MAILGIDEVGRGSIAGPLVVGAVVLAEDIAGLADSKLLSKKRRAELSKLVIASGAGVGLGWVAAGKIDEIGMAEALRLATRRAVRAVQKSKVTFHEIMIDGTINFLEGTALERYTSTLVKADQKVHAVSAAAIVAKVARDEYMTKLAAAHPEYGFEKHVGYGTAGHFAAIERHGVCPEHRLSIQPLQKYRGVDAISSVQTPDIASARRSHTPFARRSFHSAATAKNVVKNTTKIGNRAEDVVVEMLERQGHEVLARNFKTPLVEIDIISKHDEKYYFTEVKYRRTIEHGDGLAAITDQKLHKMQLGVEIFAKLHKIPNFAPLLAVASVEGDDYHIQSFFTLGA
ncbi:MAG: ribonuclease HII [Candidatus Nomurabacteria bacterium]|jgi:ribonuclease HII|nr:ribonuclease HII [Candidatus Nomurabacteria bacterium]